MANVQKTLTYLIPDELFSTVATKGRTSTQLFDGPDEIVIYTDKDTGHIHESFIPEEEPDRPLPQNIERTVFKAKTDTDFVKIALIYGGLEKPLVYEVNVGPVDQPNAILKDPTDIREVYDEFGLMQNWTGALKFKQNLKDRDDEFIRRIRNQKLAASDGRVAEDMPAELKQAWLDYRQKLRDLPLDWADCPNWLIRFPMSPDDEFNPDFDDPEVQVIRVEDRTEFDLNNLKQLPAGVS